MIVNFAQMMKLIDTHAHIYLSDFEDDLDSIIQNSKDTGIEKIFMPNIDSNSIGSMLALEKRFDNYCIPMMGVHPCDIKNNYKEELQIAKSWCDKREFCAIGEIGIDLYWDKTFIEQQVKAFETQINWAKDLNIPIVIHCRESLDMTIDIVSKYQDGNLKGIFHCFSGDTEHAKKITDLNFLLGIGGVVTFKNGGLDKVLPEVDLNNLVLETDSPYLTPTPFRGKRNEPAYLVHIITKIAELHNCRIEDVAEITTKNALNIFNYG